MVLLSVESPVKNLNSVSCITAIIVESRAQQVVSSKSYRNAVKREFESRKYAKGSRKYSGSDVKLVKIDILLPELGSDVGEGQLKVD